MHDTKLNIACSTEQLNSETAQTTFSKLTTADYKITTTSLGSLITKSFLFLVIRRPPSDIDVVSSDKVWSYSFWVRWLTTPHRKIWGYRRSFGWYSFKTVTDTNMTELENSTEFHKVHLGIFDMCSISYSANVNVIFEFVLCTSLLWLIDVDNGLWHSLSKPSKGLWHRRLVYLGLQTPISKIRMEYGPVI
jgi:hypothetical protein